MTKGDGDSLKNAFRRQRELEDVDGVQLPSGPIPDAPGRVDLQPLEGKIYLEMIKQYNDDLRPLTPAKCKAIVGKFSKTMNPSATLNRMTKAGALTQDATRKNHVSRIPIRDIAVFVEGRQIWPEASFVRIGKKPSADPPAAVPVKQPQAVDGEIQRRRELELHALEQLRLHVDRNPVVYRLVTAFRSDGLDENHASSMVSNLRFAGVQHSPRHGEFHFDPAKLAAFIAKRRLKYGMPKVEVSITETPATVPFDDPAPWCGTPGMAAVDSQGDDAPAVTGEMERHTPTAHERAAMVPPEPKGSMEERINARLAQLDEHDREIDAQVASLTAQRNRNAGIREELARLLQEERDLKQRASDLGIL